MHNEKCPICRIAVDEKGDCGCDPPFKFDAIPKPKLEGIARTIFPHIYAYYQVPENKEKFEIWNREYQRRKAAGIKPSIPSGRPSKWEQEIQAALST
jgi:hypothetical protein